MAKLWPTIIALGLEWAVLKLASEPRGSENIACRIEQQLKRSTAVEVARHASDHSRARQVCVPASTCDT